MGKLFPKFCVGLTVFLLIPLSSLAWGQDFTIVVDYTYDTNNFFNTQERRDALEAAAARFSRIIDSNLTAVGPSGTGTGTPPGWRIGFRHPGTGNSIEVSTASSFESDSLAGAGAADVYGFTGLGANEWILYAGGRSLSVAGQGGTGSGTNFFSTLDDLDGPMHRGVISNQAGGGATEDDLPAWGGAITFDNDGSTNWHFDLDSESGFGEVDFYSIALHEIGHALGLGLSFNQWTSLQSGSAFSGSETLDAYNADNGTSLTSLNTVDASNFHWEDGTYDSEIFAAGNPNLTGTVGTGALQDLLMEPIANFTGTVRRLELTNTDVAALRDLGWSTIAAVPEPGSFVLLLTLGAMATSRRRRRVESL